MSVAVNVCQNLVHQRLACWLPLLWAILSLARASEMVHLTQQPKQAIKSSGRVLLCQFIQMFEFQRHISSSGLTPLVRDSGSRTTMPAGSSPCGRDFLAFSLVRRDSHDYYSQLCPHLGPLLPKPAASAKGKGQTWFSGSCLVTGMGSGWLPNTFARTERLRAEVPDCILALEPYLIFS